MWLGKKFWFRKKFLFFKRPRLIRENKKIEFQDLIKHLYEDMREYSRKKDREKEVFPEFSQLSPKDLKEINKDVTFLRRQLKKELLNSSYPYLNGKIRKLLDFLYLLQKDVNHWFLFSSSSSKNTLYYLTRVPKSPLLRKLANKKLKKIEEKD